MTKKFVEFVIDEDGNVEIEANGYTDGSCRQATLDYEKALGVVTSRKIKDQACVVQKQVHIKK